MLVLIKGAGDLATGVAHRLYGVGVSVVMTELEAPTAVRRGVAFSQCIYDGVAEVEGVTARRAEGLQEVSEILGRGDVAVLADPTAAIRDKLPFAAVIDAVLAKRNTGTRITDAPVVIALGRGFTGGKDCHGVVETQRGPELGRLLLAGSAAPDTGIPGEVAGYSAQRVLRVPADGIFEPLAAIGDFVDVGEPVARVAGIPVRSGLSGMVRGLLPRGIPVKTGMKAGDVDPRREPELCRTISDKARRVAEGVLEGIRLFGKEET